MATEAQSLRSRSCQLDARHVFIDAHFVATQASRCDRRVNRLALGLIFVALEALRGIDVFIERNRVLFGEGRHCPDHEQECEPAEEYGEGLTDAWSVARLQAIWSCLSHFQPMHVHDPLLCA